LNEPLKKLPGYHPRRRTGARALEAIGTIIGTAMGSLDKGKGKIPVLVLLH